MIALGLQYFLEIRHLGNGLRAKVNGIDIGPQTNVAARMFGARLNPWLRQGGNSIFVSFEPISQDREAKVEISTVNSAGVDTIVFDSGETGGAPVQYSLTITERTGSALERALPRALSGHDQSAMIAILEKLHAALETKQADRVVELQRVQIEEQAISVGLSAATSLLEYQSFLEELWNTGIWRVGDLSRSAIRIEPTSLGNIFRVTTSSNAPPIITSNGETRFSISPYFAYVDGAWKIVR